MRKYLRRAAWGLAGGAIFASLGLSANAAGVTNVDVKLVIATDVSRSINDEEALVQRQGTAEAFLNEEVVKAIQSGALGRIAVSMLDFSSPEYGRVVLDWHIINNKATAAAFAEKIRNSARTPGRRTSISSALELGTLLIQGSDADIRATRKVIDVSGDGPNNDGNSMQEAHDKTIAAGIIVNGLPVMDDNANGYYPELDKYYAGCVVGGRGAFVVVVRSFRDFGAAMRHKLILEVSQNESQIRQVLNEMEQNRAIKRIAAGPGAPSGPEVLRPGQNEYSKNCDRNGFGYGGF
ncbi:MAG: DUF1194 domain-containing protein [Alphaproteobacteria bacterium]|nr:DUF1194 domain-containing protein [Alphaproteobacteria bacterium]